VDSAADLEGKAVLTASFRSGSLVLASKAESVVLSWKEGDADRRRGVPPGTWRWRSTRIEREKDGESWVHSSSQGTGGEFRFEAGGDPPMTLVAEGKAAFRGTAKRQGAALHLGFDLRDEGGHGISVYRKGKRIEVRWRLLGKDGKELAAGPMTYG
jgi:hypothetical protein